MCAAKLPTVKTLQRKHLGPFPAEGARSKVGVPGLVPSPSPACSGWMVLGASVSSSALWAEPHPLRGPGEAQPWPQRVLPAVSRAGSTHGARTQFLRRLECLAESEPRRASLPLLLLQTPPPPAPSRRCSRSRLGVLVLLCLADPSCCICKISCVSTDHIPLCAWAAFSAPSHLSGSV